MASSTRQSADDLERQMARVVCAQICKDQGFDTARVSALDALSEASANFDQYNNCYVIPPGSPRCFSRIFLL